jgi:pre-rRNA-processing protein TSR3
MLRYEIIVDHGESSNKCTILPLSYRPDFVLLRGSTDKPLLSEILLHPDGLPFDELKSTKISTVAAIDCVWRRLTPILNRLGRPLPLAVKIPEEFVTAYPRRSKKSLDPTAGLATIEALFIAAAFLGSWDLTLLKEYFFADRFLELNKAAFRRYDLIPEGDLSSPVYQPRHMRNSHHRRIARGRFSEKTPDEDGISIRKLV